VTNIGTFGVGVAKIHRIRYRKDLDRAIASLAASDVHMRRVAKLVGPLSLGAREEGFEALMSIVASQQLSAAAADTIFGRLRTAIEPFEPANFLTKSDELLRACGLSAPKQRHMRSIASRIVDGSLDLNRVRMLADEDAHAHLVETKGIGPWTAEIYLMFGLGRADIWPAGDLALQVAVAEFLGLRKRPDTKAMIKIGERYRPWRAVAARLFWAHARSKREQEKRKGKTVKKKPKADR
jgi:DNA-3-methyladenine glycosylase II